MGDLFKEIKGLVDDIEEGHNVVKRVTERGQRIATAAANMSDREKVSVVAGVISVMAKPKKRLAPGTGPRPAPDDDEAPPAHAAEGEVEVIDAEFESDDEAPPQASAPRKTKGARPGKRR